jgi:hypothetical protein
MEQRSQACVGSPFTECLLIVAVLLTGCRALTGGRVRVCLTPLTRVLEGSTL